MPGPGGLLGRRKASFSAGMPGSSNNNDNNISNSNSTGDNNLDGAYGGSGFRKAAGGGVKLTLENEDEDDELDAAEMADGGLKLNNYSFTSHGAHLASGFPVVGTGSRYVHSYIQF
jgi:hypothetical protein